MTIGFVAVAKKRAYFSAAVRALPGATRLIAPERVGPPRLRAVLARARLKGAGELHWIADYSLRVAAQRYGGRSQLFRRLLARLLLVKAWLKLVQWYGFFRENPVHAVVLWNGSHLNDRAITLAARKLNIRVLFMENGPLPNSTVLDESGVNFAGSAAQHWRRYQRRSRGAPGGAQPHPPAGPAALVPRELAIGRVAEPAIALPARFIFVPFQVDDDTQIVLYSPWIRSMTQLFDVLTGCLAELQDDSIHLVFKAHPSSPRTYPALRARGHPRVRFANGNATEELIRRTQAVVTVNSSVGVESLLLGVPVITLGQACYAQPGLTAPDRGTAPRRRARHLPAGHRHPDTALPQRRPGARADPRAGLYARAAKAETAPSRVAGDPRNPRFPRPPGAFARSAQMVGSAPPMGGAPVAGAR